MFAVPAVFGHPEVAVFPGYGHGEFGEICFPDKMNSPLPREGEARGILLRRSAVLRQIFGTRRGHDPLHVNVVFDREA